MIVLQFALLIIDPGILTLFTRSFAREEAEVSYFRCFFINIAVLALGVGLSTLFTQVDVPYWFEIEVAAVALLTCTLLSRTCCVRFLKSIPIGLVFIAYKAAIAYCIFYAFQGEPTPADLITVPFPVVEAEQVQWLSPDFWYRAK